MCYRTFVVGALTALPLAGGCAPSPGTMGMSGMPDMKRMEQKQELMQKLKLGTVDIALDVKKPTQVVWLHGKGLIVKEATLEQGGITQPVKPSSLRVMPGSSRPYRCAYRERSRGMKSSCRASDGATTPCGRREKALAHVRCCLPCTARVAPHPSRHR